MSGRVLVAGVGNVFFGDDGFGVEVVRRLGAMDLPGVTVTDYGIRGLHLAYDLLEPVDLLIAIDAAPRGGTPGTLYAIEPDLAEETGAPAEAHGMTLGTVLATVCMMGGVLPRVIVVGCEPHDTGEHMGLSAVVAAALEPAVEMVRSLLLREQTMAAAPAAKEAVP